ncbi:MAG: hypothetical protein IT536_15220, partial [Hyphomicrobiales bacterium]|nr:hypothetical protein [Hyphomicrobiales bacterium]
MRDHGARGDLATDDTAAIQAVTDTARQRGEAAGSCFTSCSGDAARLDGAAGRRIARGEIATASERHGLVPAGEACTCIIQGNYIALSKGTVPLGGIAHMVCGNLLDVGIFARPDIDVMAIACTVSGKECLPVDSPQSIAERGGANSNTISGNIVQDAINRRDAKSRCRTTSSDTERQGRSAGGTAPQMHHVGDFGHRGGQDAPAIQHHLATGEAGGGQGG